MPFILRHFYISLEYCLDVGILTPLFAGEFFNVALTFFMKTVDLSVHCLQKHSKKHSFYSAVQL